jgi:cadmium resistance protein CadD (predicted permease)
MGELKEFFTSADKGLAAITVVLVQIIKIWLPQDPEAAPGKGTFTVAERWKRILLPLTFVIGLGLSLLFSPNTGNTIQGRIIVGLQTGGLAVVIWELYSNWVRPFFENQV